jgi:hypothetical protein
VVGRAPLSRLFRGRVVLLLPALGHVIAAHIEVGVALRALLHRSPLCRREGRPTATFLASGFNERASYASGAPCTQFRRAALELVEYGLRPLHVHPLHPDLGLVDFRDKAADPPSDRGHVLRDICFQPSVKEGIAHEDSLQVIRRIIDSNWIA